MCLRPDSDATSPDSARKENTSFCVSTKMLSPTHIFKSKDFVPLWYGPKFFGIGTLLSIFIYQALKLFSYSKHTYKASRGKAQKAPKQR
jgi:hypothetical protein